MLIDDCKRVMPTPYDLSSCYQVGEQSDQQNAILDVFSSEIKNEIGASFPSLYYTARAGFAAVPPEPFLRESVLLPGYNHATSESNLAHCGRTK